MNKEIKTENGEYLTLQNYKEPLRKVENGYGFMGTLLNTIDGEKVQCHICGKLFKCLNVHIRKTHGINPREYQEKFQLAKSTSLISERERERKSTVTREWQEKLPEERRKAFYERTVKAMNEKRLSKKINRTPESLETKNKKGTCPDQILDKIKSVIFKLNRVPTIREFVEECGTQRYMHLIYKVYGNWDNALARLNKVRKSSDSNKNKYSDEELLDYLRDFYKFNKREPVASDCTKGLLPSSMTYMLRFGSWNNAKKLAGIKQ